MVLLIVIIVLGIVALYAYLFLQRPQFGKPPGGELLKKIEASPNYKNGQFQNLSHTPALAEGATYGSAMRQFIFEKSKRATPAAALPSKKIDLLALDVDKDVLVWFGHSSYFLQLSGKRFLVDPVFSGSASPVRFTTRSFKGSDVYTTDDIPPIDYLLITHDHYDHLDYRTITELKPKISKIIIGLGVSSHFEKWGFASSMIDERDWNETVVLEQGFSVHTTPARHFSGRKFKRNNTLWTSFVLTTPTKKLFIGGDSGYDTHFKKIGDQHGPFDLVILEDGQYNAAWKYIHMMPEEVVQAAEDLKAFRLMPVHWGKFSLALHDWDEPIRRVIKEAGKRKMPLLHPAIGEPVYLDYISPSSNWWEMEG
jgi:L-ascorbate metabolism protein UlaG (beta-lactamase superfamily)